MPAEVAQAVCRRPRRGLGAYRSKSMTRDRSGVLPHGARIRSGVRAGRPAKKTCHGQGNSAGPARVGGCVHTAAPHHAAGRAADPRCGRHCCDWRRDRHPLGAGVPVNVRSLLLLWGPGQGRRYGHALWCRRPAVRPGRLPVPAPDRCRHAGRTCRCIPGGQRSLADRPTTSAAGAVRPMIVRCQGGAAR